MRATVIIREWDLSTRVPSFPGVYGGIVIPAKKGDVGKATLATNETDLLRRFTPDETVKVGYDLSYYSALAFLIKSNKLWISRAVNNPKYGGVYLGQRIPQVTPIVKSSNVDMATGILTLSHISDVDYLTAKSFLDVTITGEKVTVTPAAGGTLPAPLAINTSYYLVEIDYETFKIGLATTYEDAIEGNTLKFTGVGTGSFTINVPIVSHNSNVEYAMTTPANYDLNSSNGKPSGMEGSFVPDSDNDWLMVDLTFFSWIVTGDKIQLKSDGTLPTIDSTATPPTSFLEGTDYYVIKSRVTEGKIWLAASEADALNGVYIEFDSNGTLPDPDVDKHYVLYSQNTELSGVARKSLLIYAKDPGAWNNDVYVSVVNYPYIPWDGDTTKWTEAEVAAATLVKEPDCFLIYVFKKDADGNVYQAENPWLCSRIKNKKDGYGQNCYVQDVLESSNYIRALDNLAVHESVKPLDQWDLANGTAEYLKLAKGSDGSTVTDSNMLKSLDVFQSRRDIACTVLMDGGYAVPSFQKRMDEIAQIRKDCVSILCTPYSTEVASDYITAILKYRKYELNLNSSYSALYTPHLLIQDKYNDRKIFVPADGYVGAAISETAANYEIWYPPAGPRRGVLNVLDLSRRFSEGDQDVLYDNNINPIDYYPGRGIRIWGQKTLLSRPSALDRLNVRLLLIVIEPAIAEFLEDFLFELNDEITRALVTSGIDSYMEGIRTRRGVYAYKTKCDDENNPPEVIDANEMVVYLYVQPVKAVEFIKFTVIITRTGASFSLG